MRKIFVDCLFDLMEDDKEIIVLLGDLGFGLFDNIRRAFPKRCINMGASEQLIIGAASGLALEGRIPICYSITPFLLYRPFEFIRNYLNIEGIGVKLVGSGRDRDYQMAGYTHNASDARGILNGLPNIVTFFPESEKELTNSIHDFVYQSGPAFLSLKK